MQESEQQTENNEEDEEEEVIDTTRNQPELIKKDKSSKLDESGLSSFDMGKFIY